MIQVEHLTKRYGFHTAIEDVTFEVKKGEILGFLGPNGAGKTTTMRILAGFFPASEGRALVAGHDVFEEPLQAKRKVGYLPENPPLYTSMTVNSFLHFAGTIKGVPKSQLSARVERVQERCGLQDVAQRLIKHLSKGYRQRVGLAQALIHEPEVLILDEPTVGLDPKQIIEVRELIRNLAGEHTVILSTHILPEVSMTCERVIIINRGKIVAVDTPQNLTSQLHGGETIEVEVSGPVERLGEALAVIPEIRSVSAGESRDGHHVAILEAHGEQDVRHLVARSLIDSGFELYELRTMTMTLEEIFLKLTTEEENA